MDEQNPDGITAYHGSPHEFEQFDTSKIGTGEGAQAFGHGLYFAEAEPVAKEYRDALQNPTISVKGKEFPLASQAANEIYPYENLSYPENINWSEVLYPIHHALTKMQNYEMDLDAAIDDMRSNYSHYKPEYIEKAEQLIRSVKPEIKNKGHMYEVHIDAHPDHFLDWDKPLSQQSEYVKNALANHTPLYKYMPYEPKDTGRDIYYKNKINTGGKDIASNELMSLGIHGIKYLDAGSRGPLASWSTDKLTHNYVVFDHNRVNIKRRYAEGGEVEAYEDGGEIPNPMSIFPKPQRMFPEDAPVAGGQYLSMPDKTDVTGHKAAVASIGVYPGGKPYFTASRDAVEETGTPGRGSATAKTNLFKQKAGWKWKDAPEGHEDTTTIVSVEHRGKHHYTLNAHFPKGVDLARYENSPTEPRLRPTTRGNVELGPVAGTILVRGREHPVYHHVIVKNAGGEVDGYDNGGSTYEPHKRAEEQGYEIKGYHVTRGSSAGQISSAKRFDPARNMMNEPATFFWDNPKAANEWAHYAAGTPSFDPNEMLDRHVDRVERHETAVMPVRIKKGKHLVVNWDNTTGSPFYDNKRMALILNNARDQGYDTVRIKNMIETGPMSVEDFERGHATGEFPQAHDQIAVLNPAMIRSEFAQFDPERQHENDIGAKKGGVIAKTPAKLHNPAIVEHALGKISAPPPALDPSLMVAKRGRPF